LMGGWEPPKQLGLLELAKILDKTNKLIRTIK